MILSTISARTFSIAVIFICMVPLGIFLVSSYNQQSAPNERVYSLHVYLCALAFYFSTSFVENVTGSIHRANEKDCNWLMKKPWLFCFFMAQFMCSALDMWVLIKLYGSTELKLNWDINLLKYALNTNMSYEDYANLTNYYLLEKPSIAFLIWVIVINLINFAFLLAYSVMNDMKKAKISSHVAVVVKSVTEKDPVRIGQAFHSTPRSKFYNIYGSLYNPPLIYPLPKHNSNVFTQTANIN